MALAGRDLAARRQRQQPGQAGRPGEADALAGHTFGDDTPYRGYAGDGWPDYCWVP